MSNLANEFDVRSILHGQVSLAAVNQIYVVQEAMNGCKTLKIHLRLALKMFSLLTLSFWGVGVFCVIFVCLFSSKFNFSKNYFRNTIKVSNDKDPNCLQWLSVDDKTVL